MTSWPAAPKEWVGNADDQMELYERMQTCLCLQYIHVNHKSMDLQLWLRVAPLILKKTHRDITPYFHKLLDSWDTVYLKSTEIIDDKPEEYFRGVTFIKRLYSMAMMFRPDREGEGRRKYHNVNEFVDDLYEQEM
jgi:hypothetical protein